MNDLKIIKIGGKVVEDDSRLTSFLENFARISSLKMLVHGGGKWVSEMSQRLGIEVKMIDGRRITDAETMEVVKMMLAGVANKNIVSKLQAFRCNALGMTGADGNTIQAMKRPVMNGIDYGFVGDVKTVNNTALVQVIGNGFVPVFASLTHDGCGTMLNTNADTIASSLALGLICSYNVELIYCFELNGVLRDIHDPESIIPLINKKNYQELKDEKIISEGMIPKIDNAFNAIRNGVKSVRIMNSTHIDRYANGDTSVGTVISM